MKLLSKVLQVFLLFSLYFSSVNLKYLKLTKMELTRFAMKLFTCSRHNDHNQAGIEVVVECVNYPMDLAYEFGWIAVGYSQGAVSLEML